MQVAVEGLEQRRHLSVDNSIRGSVFTDGSLVNPVLGRPPETPPVGAINPNLFRDLFGPDPPPTPPRDPVDPPPDPEPVEPAPAPVPVFIGTFGGSDRLEGTAPTTGAPFTLQLNVGSGQAFLRDGKLDLQLDGTQSRSTLTIRSKTPLTLGNVVVNGSLRSVRAPTANLSGAFAVRERLGAMHIGNVDGGTLTVGATMGKLSADGLSNARIITGAGVAAANEAGGLAGYESGSLGSISVRNVVVDTVVACGVEPGADGAYGTADDVGEGTGESRISSISIRGGVSGATTFTAAAFPRVAKLAARVRPASDGHFSLVL